MLGGMMGKDGAEGLPGGMDADGLKDMMKMMKEVQKNPE